MKPVPPYLRVKFRDEVWHDEPDAQNPIDFFNRIEPKKQALAILHSPETRRAIWLVGERRSGKTSMLKLLLEKFKSQEGFLAIEVPWQSIYSPTDFYKEFLCKLDQEISSSSEFPVNSSLTFWESLRERQPNIGQRTLVVGIDEIDSILMDKVQDDKSKNEILGCILRLVTQEPNIKVILTSVRSSNKIEQFKASPLVSRSQEILLQPFSDEDIDKLIRSLGQNISEKVIENIIYLSGAWPFYAKAVLENLLQLPSIDAHGLEQAQIAAVKEIASTCEHLYRHHWNDDEQRALWLLVNKERIQQEEFNQLDVSIRTAFRELTERGYVIEEDKQYRFRVVLIADWFKGLTRREIEEERLELPSLLKKIGNPWAKEPGEHFIQISKEDLRRRGF